MRLEMRLSLLFFTVFLAAPQLGTPSRLDAELARVRAQIKASVPADEQASLVQRLDRAEAALKAERTYQAVYLPRWHTTALPHLPLPRRPARSRRRPSWK
jgi:hypothetical protein